jgi:hypothetical protein
MPSSAAVRNSAETPLPSVYGSLSDLEKTNYLRNLFLEARDAKRQRYDSWLRNYRLVNNRISGNTYTSWAPQPRDSEIFPLLSSWVGWMTDQNPEIVFFPTMEPFSKFYSFVTKIAQDLNALYATNYDAEDYEAHLKLALWDDAMYGLGIIKNVWDNGASGGAGNAVIRRVDPWSFYPDPFATSMYDAEYFVEARRVSWNQLYRMYPRTVHLLRTPSSSTDGIDERPNIYTDSNIQPKAPFLGSITPGGTSVWNKSNSYKRGYDPLPGYVVYEYWLKDNWQNPDMPPIDETPWGNERYAQARWKCIVMCNSVILFEEWADELWDHGQHPYSDFKSDNIGEFYGISLVDHLAYPQIYINRLLTAAQHNTELVGNPIFLEPTNSGLGRVGIINRPGTRLPISNQTAAAGGNFPRWLEPPNLPAALMELVSFWIERMENIMGLTGVQKGQVPNQRSAEGVIQSVQEAAMVRIRSAMTNYANMLRDSAYKIADLICQNFTEKRTVAILGQNGQYAPLFLAGHHFYDPATQGDTPLKFVVRAEAGANKPTSRNARMQEAERLFALGAVDDQYVLDSHGIPDADQMLQRLYKKRMDGLIGMGGAGARQRTGRQG